MPIDWEKAFSDSEQYGSISIQNTKPPHDTARNIYQDDEKEILRVAAKLGWRRLVVVNPKTGQEIKPKVQSFVKVKCEVE